MVNAVTALQALELNDCRYVSISIVSVDKKLKTFNNMFFWWALKQKIILLKYDVLLFLKLFIKKIYACIFVQD